jgi:hypothetical protein
MPDLTSTSATTAQVAKAVQRGVHALLENIQASKRTSEPLYKNWPSTTFRQKAIREYYIRGRGYIFLQYQT